MIKVALISAGLLIFLQLSWGNPVKRAADCDGCTYDGNTYAVNDTWTIDCITYKCVDVGTYHPVIYRCKDPISENCYDLGYNWTTVSAQGDIGYCYDFTCIPNGNSVFPQHSNPRCRYQSSCLENATSLDTANCLTRTCEIGINAANQYTFLLHTTVTQGCNGTCTFGDDTYNAGQEWYDRCVRYTCVSAYYYTGVRECCEVNINYENTTRPVGNFPIDCNIYECLENGSTIISSKGCRDNTGNCVPVNATWSNGCINFRCEDIGSRGQTKVTRIACKDDNLCHDAGTTWVGKTYGMNYPDTGFCANKTCVFNGTHVYSEITGYDCLLDGECYPQNEVRDYGQNSCKDITCFETSPGNITTSFRSRCLDYEGNCYDYGTLYFPLVINGTVCDNCTCNLLPSGTVSYTCVYL